MLCRYLCVAKCICGSLFFCYSRSYISSYCSSGVLQFLLLSSVWLWVSLVLASCAPALNFILAGAFFLLIQLFHLWSFNICFCRAALAMWLCDDKAFWFSCSLFFHSTRLLRVPFFVILSVEFNFQSLVYHFYSAHFGFWFNFALFLVQSLILPKNLNWLGNKLFPIRR